MTYPVLPPALPGLALRDDWTLTPDDPHRRTEMDDGAVAVTRKNALLRAVYAVSWDLSALEYDAAVAFWADELNAGQSWFIAPVVMGRGNTPQRVRFASTPPWTATSPANGRFQLTFELEVKDLPRLTSAQRIAIYEYLDPGIDVAEVTGRIAALNAILDGMATWP